jgi:hypothetical protein
LSKKQWQRLGALAISIVSVVFGLINPSRIHLS